MTDGLSDADRWDGFAAPPPGCSGGAVAVGNFDGVHLGHAALLRTLRRHADALGGPAVVVSFDPHPMQLLDPGRFQPLLTDPETRAGLLRAAGADAVILLRTTPVLLRLSAEEFFDRLLRERLNVRAMVEGFNFRFGRDRAGDTALLERMCRGAGVRFEVVPPLEADGAPVSSSRVRDALLAGDVATAARLLGRRFAVHGRVAEGAKRGRTIGFPTANLTDVATLLPGDGVYAATATVGEATYAAAVNVGPNPTFGETARKVEAHLIDFAGDLYGREITVVFAERLRGTRPFGSAAELIEQLRRDVERLRGMVPARSGSEGSG